MRGAVTVVVRMVMLVIVRGSVNITRRVRPNVDDVFWINLPPNCPMY